MDPHSCKVSCLITCQIWSDDYSRFGLTAMKDEWNREAEKKGSVGVVTQQPNCSYILIGFRTCHIEIICSLSNSFSSYNFDTNCIVHH